MSAASEVPPAPVAPATAVDRPPGVPADYPIPDVPVTRLFEDAVRDAPDGTAVLAGAHRRTWAEVAAVATDLERRLAAVSVGPGDAVLVEVADHPDGLAAWWAVWRRAAVAVPGPTDRPGPVRAVVAAVARSSAGASAAEVAAADTAVDEPPVVLLEALREGPVARLGARLGSRLRGWTGPSRGRHRGSVGVAVRAVADAGPPDDHPTVAGSLPALRVPAGPPSVPSAGGPADGPASDPVVLTHAQLVASAFQVRLWVPDARATRERVLAVDPWDDPTTLVAGPLLATLTAGTLVVVASTRGPARVAPTAGDPAAVADAVAAAVDRTVATIAVLPAAVLRPLARRAHATRRDLTSLRVALVVGAPLPWHAAGALVTVTGGAAVRGLAALGGALPTHAHPVYGRVRAGTAGMPLTGTRSWRGPDGRLHVAGAQVGDAAIDTGLVADVDDDGTVTVHGPAGELLALDPPLGPVAVEQLLEQHAGVERAAVVARTDGPVRRVVAVVEGPRRHRPTVPELAAYLRARLGEAAVPDEVRWVTVPTTPRGDVDRDGLRALVAAPTARPHRADGHADADVDEEERRS